MEHVSTYKINDYSKKDLLSKYDSLVRDFKVANMTSSNSSSTEYLRGKLDMLSFIAINMLDITGEELDAVAEKIYEEEA